MEKLSKLPLARQIVGGSVGFEPMQSDMRILALFPLGQGYLIERRQPFI